MKVAAYRTSKPSKLTDDNQVAMSSENIPPRSRLEDRVVTASDRARKAARHQVGSTSGVAGSSSGAVDENSGAAEVRSGGVDGPIPPVEEDRGDIGIVQHVEEVLADIEVTQDVDFDENLGDVGDEDEEAGGRAKRRPGRQRRSRGRGRGREGGGGDDEVEVLAPTEEQLATVPPSRSIIADQHADAHCCIQLVW
ncbi:hypothetical protein Dimus_038301 [Dionaea muscipula]